MDSPVIATVTAAVVATITGIVIGKLSSSRNKKCELDNAQTIAETHKEKNILETKEQKKF